MLNKNIKLICLLIFVQLTASCYYPKLDNMVQGSQPESFTANHNYARTSFLDITLQDTLVSIWEDNISGQPVQNFLDISDNLVFTTRNGYLYTMGTDNPEKMAKKQLTKNFGTTPTVHNNLLYIPANNGDKGLIIYDILSGTIISEFDNMLSQSSPIIFENNIIHATLDGNIFSFNLTSFEKNWSIEIKDNVLNNLALQETNLIVASQNGLVRNYNIQTGTLNWSLKIMSSIYATPILDNKSVYICSYSGELIKINLLSGDIKARVRFDAPIYLSPGLDNQSLYVPISSGKLHKLSKNNLNEEWQILVNAPFSAPLLVTNNKILAGTTYKSLYVIDKETSEISQKLKFNGRLRTSPFIHKNKVYIGHEKENISVFSIGAANENK